MKPDADGLWLVVYMTHNLQTLEAVENMLTEEGFLVRRRALSRAVSNGSAYELHVLESEAKEAHQLIREKGY